MEKISYPISRTEENMAIVSLPKSIYEAEALRQSAYKFSGEYNVIIQENGPNFDVLFETKQGEPVTDKQVKEICNDFIDQQIRIDTEKQFGHIRNLIVEEAFKPVNK